MNLETAEKIAQRAFKEHFQKRKIPETIAEALSRQAYFEFDMWQFEITISLPQVEPKRGLMADRGELEPVLMATVKVDIGTGEAIVEESKNILW